MNRRQLLKGLVPFAGAMAIPMTAFGKGKPQPALPKAGQYMRVTLTTPNVMIERGSTARFRIPFDTVAEHRNDPDGNLEFYQGGSDGNGIRVNEPGLYQVNGGVAFGSEKALVQERHFAIMTGNDERFPLVHVIDQTSDLVEANDAGLAASTMFTGAGRLVCWVLSDIFVHTEPDQQEGIAPIRQTFLEVGRIA